MHFSLKRSKSGLLTGMIHETGSSVQHSGARTRKRTTHHGADAKDRRGTHVKETGVCDAANGQMPLRSGCIRQSACPPPLCRKHTARDGRIDVHVGRRRRPKTHGSQRSQRHVVSASALKQLVALQKQGPQTKIMQQYSCTSVANAETYTCNTSILRISAMMAVHRFPPKRSVSGQVTLL